MTDNESITELRAWAAEVCGYKIDDRWAYAQIRVLPPRMTTEQSDRLKALWLPDQNIAQAFELLDAVRGESEAVLTGFTKEWMFEIFRHPRVFSATHASRCMAILLACRQAWEAAQ